MIPSSEHLQKKLNKPIVEYILLNHSNYFQQAERFVELTKTFVRESFLEQMFLWVEMVIQPLVSIIMMIFFGKEVSIFTLFEIQKLTSIWYKWFEFKQLAFQIRQWRNVVQSVGGPFISTNDANYHVYVYADGMQRLSLVLSEKLRKRTK